MSSFSILAMAGTVSSRVLSLGPVLDVFSSGVVSSLGTLKPPGLSLLVAVLSRRPARKKEAMSATPAAIMSRLNTQETTFPALDLLMLYFFMTAAIVTSKLPFDPRSTSGRSTFYGQILPHAPLVPRTVVDGQPPVPEPVQREERHRGGNPTVAVCDHGLLLVLGYTSLPQPARQLLIGEKGAALGIKEAVGMQMGGTGYVTRPARLAHHGAGVLALVARVDNEGVVTAGEEIFGLPPPAGPGFWGEDGRPRFGDPGRRRAALSGPLRPAAVENGDRVVAIVRKRPPQPGGELAARVVVDDDVGIVADPERAHRLSEAVRRSDLCRHGVVGVGDVAGPIHVDGAGDVCLVVLLAGGEVLGLLATLPEVRLLHVPPYVHDANVPVFQVVGEPVRRDEGIELFHITPRRWRDLGRRF